MPCTVLGTGMKQERRQTRPYPPDLPTHNPGRDTDLCKAGLRVMDDAVKENKTKQRRVIRPVWES